MKKENEVNIINDDFDIDELIDKYTPYIKTIIYNMVGENLSYEDKEEILSDTFFILWKNRNNKILSLDSYISGITKNLVKEKLKKRKITYDISDYENVIEYSQLQKMFPAEREEISKVESILENFKEIDLKIFKLFYYQDMSIKDIAKEERTSEFNVKTRLYRIRKKIKKELNDGGYYGK